jgi:speckle-type POZ protein
MVNETSSTHQSVAATGVHRLRVVGHSLLKGTDTRIKSATFRVGGHDWAVVYLPDGEKKEGSLQDHVSVFLRLLNAAVVKDEVVTSMSFCLEDPTSGTAGTIERTGTVKFSAKSQPWGYPNYMSKTDLAASGCIKDDCLVIKCAVNVITSKLINNDNEEEEDVAVPPAELDNHLGRLLETGVATDITIKIGWLKQFKAHRCVLAARSPVFRALLCGSMMESKKSSIRVVDIDADVFKILLQYMYDESTPAFMEETTEDAANMTKDLLIAADRYGIERLKLICERKLSKALDVNTVCSALEFADRHSCLQLKNCCLAYIVKDRERLKAIVRTQGFDQLDQNCHSILSEILVKSLHI